MHLSCVSVPVCVSEQRVCVHESAVQVSQQRLCVCKSVLICALSVALSVTPCVRGQEYQEDRSVGVPVPIVSACAGVLVHWGGGEGSVCMCEGTNKGAGTAILRS